MEVREREMERVEVLVESIKSLAGAAVKILEALGNAALARGKHELAARFAWLALEASRAAEELGCPEGT